MDLNRDRSCVETCQNYQFVSTDFGCSDRSICNRQSKCNGKILSCTSLQDNMWICPSSKESNRRYEYIVYDNGKSLGEEKPCRSRGFHVRTRCGPHYISRETIFLIFRWSITGSITSSGTAIIAFAYAMSKARSLIVISACDKRCQTQRTTCKFIVTFRLNLLQLCRLLGS